MASEATNALLVEKQRSGENLDTWGDKLNNALDVITNAICATQMVQVDGSVTLDHVIFQNTAAIAQNLILTGNGGELNLNIDIKSYYIFNNCASDVVIRSQLNDEYTIRKSENCFVVLNEGFFRVFSNNNKNNQKIWNVANPTDPMDVVNKQYLEQTIANYALTGEILPFPDVAGQDGKVLGNDGVNVTWETIEKGEFKSLSAEETLSLYPDINYTTNGKYYLPDVASGLVKVICNNEGSTPVIIEAQNALIKGNDAEVNDSQTIEMNIEKHEVNFVKKDNFWVVI